MPIPSDRYYEIVEQDIAHEMIDGEAIIIHFKSGNYYSLNGMAAIVWGWLQAGSTYGEVSEAFEELKTDDVAALRGFVEGLVSEGILRHGTSFDSHARKADLLPLSGHTVFLAPQFDKYNDMQHLLLSDPIHEVDERGWPHAVAGSDQTS